MAELPNIHDTAMRIAEEVLSTEVEVNGIKTTLCKLANVIGQIMVDIPHWIPCSERMPKDNTLVLYVWRSENGNVSVLHGWHYSIRGLGSAWHQSGVGIERPDDEVTHWMPLPEPPKE